MKLPPGTIFHHDLRLIAFIPRGIISEKRVMRTIEMLEKEEDRAEKPFNRFTDMSKLEAIDIDFKTMLRISLHRRLVYAKHPPVKSAFYVTTPAAARIVKIHILVTDHSPLKVRMFEDLPAAAKWLEVPLETLEMDPWAGKSRAPRRVRPAVSVRLNPRLPRKKLTA